VMAALDREFKYENSMSWSGELINTFPKREEYEKYINFQKVYIKYLKTQNIR
jgi:hypothetical protein